MKVALERNKKFDEGYKFVIPCLLEPCVGLTQLKDLHNADLVPPHGVPELTKTIQMDWQKRRSSLEVE